MKKTSLIIFLLIGIFFFSSCDVVKQIEELKRFAQCEFSLINIQIVEVDGINLKNVHSEKDFTMEQIYALGQSILNGKLPTTLSIALEAYNPNFKKAAISGLDWEVYLKNVQYASGKLKDRVEVLPQASAEFPLLIRINLMKIFTADSLNDIIALLADRNNKENIKKLELTVRLRPWYQIGQSIEPAPTFITISPLK